MTPLQDAFLSEEDLDLRNLTDEDVQTRGFGGFGNDPRKLYETEAYYQLGEPRVYGIDVRYEFR